MIFKKTFAALVVITILAIPVIADQSKPRIAVMPFNNIGVSKNDARVVTGLFETGLVKTNSYNVIEQEQMKDRDGGTKNINNSIF